MNVRKFLGSETEAWSSARCRRGLRSPNVEDVTALEQSKSELLTRLCSYAESKGAKAPDGVDAARGDEGVLPPRRARGPARARRGRPLRRGDGPAAARRRASAGQGDRPGVHPERLGQRLVRRRAHGRRGGHRRHAVPRRLGLDGAGRAAARHPPGDPPAVRRTTRPRAASSTRCSTSKRRDRPARRPPRVVDAPRDRPGLRRPARRDPGAAQQGAHRRARRRRGLAADAHPGRPDRRGPRGAPAAAPGRGARAGQVAAALARRQPLHLPRLPRVRPRGRG